MNKSEAQAAFDKMSKPERDKVEKWKRTHPEMTFEQVVAEFAVKPMPGGHADEAIASNTVGGKMRDRKRDRR
jgi:hypothetical protein